MSIPTDPSCLKPLCRMTCGSKNETSYLYSQGHWHTAPSYTPHLLPWFLWFNDSWLVGGQNGCPFRLPVLLLLFLYFMLMLLLSFILIFPDCVLVHYYLFTCHAEAHLFQTLTSLKWKVMFNSKHREVYSNWFQNYS